MIFEFEKAFTVWYGESDAREEFKVEVHTDGEGLAVDLEVSEENKKALIAVLKRKDVQEIGLYFSKDDLALILKMLWDKETIRPKAKFIWPLSLRLRKPGVVLEIE